MICILQWSCLLNQAVSSSIEKETAYGYPYHPKANVCFVAVMETFPLVKQIFRSERNIWAARMCQNRTDACLLKTCFKKNHLVLSCLGSSHNGLNKKLEIVYAFVILIPAPGLATSLHLFLSWFFSSRKWG